MEPLELPTTPLARPVTPALPLDLHPGDRIARYQLIKRLGEGGMGEVWLADQESPIQRKVALKIIKQGMDTRQVVARFEAERQVLAMLDHPNIATVYDAGATRKGRPFFVMEYVDGEPITTYCDRHKLNTTERIALILQVCEGVQHAHRNAIIHRDLKPHNVLVTEIDGRPVPKIIDFGVAKATDKCLSEHTVFTELGQLIGTPEYMSPEQTAMTSLNIDTRTDLYSLGVLLYELLTGALPFDSRELRQAGIDEICRVIREKDPQVPSARLSTLAGDTAQVARHHGTNVGKLISELRGDLDWITMKAMEKDRDRRYGTSSELAADLQRYLKSEPVVARPPSTVDRIQKFVRRHTMGVAFAGVVMVLLITLGVSMVVQAGRVATQRDRAEAEAFTAKQVSEFLVTLFKESDPTNTRGADVTAREILDAGAVRVRRELADQPTVQATMLRTIGSVYMELGLYDEARSLLQDALILNEQNPGPDSTELAATLAQLASLGTRTAADAESESLARQALALREQAFGRQSLEVAQALNILGIILEHTDRLDEAKAVHEEAIAIRQNHPEARGSALAASIHNLAIIYYFEGDLTRAEELYKQSADLELAQYGRMNHEYATSLHTLAIVYQDQGRLDEALTLERESLAIREEVLGADHLHVALSLTTMGNILRMRGEAAEGVPLLRRALAISEVALGPGVGETVWMERSLARSLAAAGQLDESVAVFSQNITAVGQVAGLDDPRVGLALTGRAAVRVEQDRLAEASADYQRGLQLMNDGWGADDPDRLEALQQYIALLDQQGLDVEAAARRQELSTLQ